MAATPCNRCVGNADLEKRTHEKVCIGAGKAVGELNEHLLDTQEALCGLGT